MLTNWFPQRTGILISQLRNAGMYPALDAPVFTPHGGIIAESLAVSITRSGGNRLLHHQWERPASAWRRTFLPMR